MSDDEVSNKSDDLVLPAVTIDQPLMPKQLPSGYWEEENDRLKQFCMYVKYNLSNFHTYYNNTYAKSKIKGYNETFGFLN